MSFLIFVISSSILFEFRKVHITPRKHVQKYFDFAETLEISVTIDSHHSEKRIIYHWIIAVFGTCLYAYGLKQGELCRRDNDCETGLMCADVAGGETRSCQPPVTSNKQYSEYQRAAGELLRQDD